MPSACDLKLHQHSQATCPPQLTCAMLSLNPDWALLLFVPLRELLVALVCLSGPTPMAPGPDGSPSDASVARLLSLTATITGAPPGPPLPLPSPGPLPFPPLGPWPACLMNSGKTEGFLPTLLMSLPAGGCDWLLLLRHPHAAMLPSNKATKMTGTATAAARAPGERLPLLLLCGAAWDQLQHVAGFAVQAAGATQVTT